MKLDSKTYIVYKHTSPQGKCYIGITSRDISKRSGHNGIHYKKNLHFYNAIQKYGWNNFKHEILESNLTEKEASERERYYVSLFHATEPLYGYNGTTGGEVHYELTQKIKEKISQKTKTQWKNKEIRNKMIKSLKESHKGVYTPLQIEASRKRRGSHLSENTKKKISQALKGRKGKPMSDELKARLTKMHIGRSPSNKGKKLSEKQRKIVSEKTREAMKNPVIKQKIKDSNKRRTGIIYKYKVYQYDLQGNLIAQHNGYANASRATNIHKNSISNCVYGKTKTAGGYIWKIDNKKEN